MSRAKPAVKVKVKVQATGVTAARGARKAPTTSRKAKPAGNLPAADVAEDYLEEPDGPETVRISDDERIEDDQASASITQQLIYRQLGDRPEPPRKHAKARPAATPRQGGRGKTLPR